MMKKWILSATAILSIATMLLWVQTAYGAFSFGSNKTHHSTSFDDPVEFTHTVSSGEDLLAICISIRDNVTNVESVTYNGDALTKAVEYNSTLDDLGTEIWYLANPDVGASQTVSVDLSTFDAIGITAASFSGVDTADPLDTTNSAEADSSSPSVNITTGKDGNLIVDCYISEDGSAPTVGAGQTLLFATDEGVWSSGSSYVIKETAGSETMDWSSGADPWVLTVASFNVAGGGGGAEPDQSYGIIF